MRTRQPVAIRVCKKGCAPIQGWTSRLQVASSVNAVPSPFHSVSLPIRTPVVDTYAILSTATCHDSDAAISSCSCGYIHETPGSVVLDFQAGVIRHQMTVDGEGYESTDDVFAQLGAVGLSSVGYTSSAPTSRKRNRPQICQDQRPSQRPRRQHADVSLSRTVSERLVTSGHTTLSMPRVDPFVCPTEFPPCHVPTSEQGPSLSLDATPSATPVPPVHPRHTSLLGTRTRDTTFPVRGERPSQRRRRQPPDVPLCAASPERCHTATHAASSMPQGESSVRQSLSTTQVMPTSEQVPSATPVSSVHPRHTSILGARTRDRPFPIHGERPSQRPRTQPLDVPLYTPSAKRCHTTIHGSSSTPQGEQFMPTPVFATHATLIFEEGPSLSSNATPSITPGPAAHGQRTSVLGRHPTARSSSMHGPPTEYKNFGPCNCVCRSCHALFWYEERLSTSTRRSGPLYHRCCLGGKVRLFLPRDYPPYIQQLFSDQQFLNNIRAYNQMFSMASLGETIDDSVNNGRGPYVFKVSGQIYHQIGRFCLLSGESPRFLQLYIYDTHNEVSNRLANFGANANNVLRPEIVEGLIRLSVRDKLADDNVPEFKIRLFGKAGSTQHELPTADQVGAIVFENGPESSTDFDVVIQRHTGEPERVNKLHPTYMSLHFPLLFIFGEQGFHTDLRLTDVAGGSSETDRRMSMDAYYAYLLHDRLDRQMAEKNMEALTNIPVGSATPSGTQDVQRSYDKAKGILVEEDVVNLMDYNTLTNNNIMYTRLSANISVQSH
ncbi:helitron helicase-like domain-containing protein [Artemisia annua]|uniref:Helitron helicase-like domain-containing protein n=1 Tax=Artemisia annua TaxID=35608 RepID=A0A2U1LAG7_ARTAN|nr:helitron helicase-like domain-containing protein [Artemisia annua]